MQKLLTVETQFKSLKSVTFAITVSKLEVVKRSQKVGVKLALALRANEMPPAELEMKLLLNMKAMNLPDTPTTFSTTPKTLKLKVKKTLKVQETPEDLLATCKKERKQASSEAEDNNTTSVKALVEEHRSS